MVTTFKNSKWRPLAQVSDVEYLKKKSKTTENNSNFSQQRRAANWCYATVRTQKLSKYY